MSLSKLRIKVLIGFVSSALVAAPLLFVTGTASADTTTWNSVDATSIDLSNYSAFGGDGYLYGVSCITGTTCVASGVDNNGDDSFPNPIQLTGDAQTWGVAATTSTDSSNPIDNTTGGSSLSDLDLLDTSNPAYHGAEITSISCTTTTTCVAVGQDGNNKPIVLIGDPASWTSASAIELTQGLYENDGGAFNSVSCLSSGWCLAVGTDDDGRVITLSGVYTTWSTTTELTAFTPTNGDDSESNLYVTGVSCVSEQDCVAVGSVTSTPTPPPVNNADLSKHQPQAHYRHTSDEPANYDLLTLNGDPSMWSTDTSTLILTPTPSNEGGSLNGVSCTSSDFCVAVGGLDTSDGQPLIFLTNNPNSWNSDEAINYYGLDDALDSYDTDAINLNSVSCVVATETSDYCAAVGEDGNDQPLVLSGDPTTWAQDSVTTDTGTNADAVEVDPQSPTNPEQDVIGVLYSVSCTAVETCAAVGHFQDYYQDSLKHSVVSHVALNNNNAPPAYGPFTAWIAPPAQPSAPSVPYVPTLYPVTYLDGAGSGTPPTQAPLSAGSTFTVASASSLSDPGSTFTGWSDGTTVYQPGATYTMPAAPVTLTAQWTPLPTTPASVTKPLLRTEVLFPFNKYYLTAQAKRQLNSFAKKIEQANVTSFTVVGSTDLFGSEGYNIPLSEHRAHAVSAYLTAQLALLGVTDVVFHDTWIGILKTQPTYTQNRRTVVAD